MKSLKHINKTELFVFQKNANYLRKKSNVMLYIWDLYTPRPASYGAWPSIIFLGSQDIFLDSDNSLSTVLIADIPNFYAQDPLLVHKGAAGGQLWNTHVRFHTQGNIRPGPNNTTSMGDPDHLERLLGATEPVFGLCLHFWVEKYTFSWACPTEE